jgi:hypothetical protein
MARDYKFKAEFYKDEKGDDFLVCREQIYSKAEAVKLFESTMNRNYESVWKDRFMYDITISDFDFAPESGGNQVFSVWVVK